jgi:hypothetical protein
MGITFFTEKELTSSRGRRGRYPADRGTLRREIAAGRFPAPIFLSPGRKVWSSAVLDAFDRQLTEQQSAAFKRESIADRTAPHRGWANASGASATAAEQQTASERADPSALTPPPCAPQNVDA